MIKTIKYKKNMVKNVLKLYISKLKYTSQKKYCYKLTDHKSSQNGKKQNPKNYKNQLITGMQLSK